MAHASACGRSILHRQNPAGSRDALQKPGNCRRFFHRKHFRGKSEDFHEGIAPGIANQACLYAGFLEQTPGRPVPFRGHLRQQEPPGSSTHHQKPVPARDNIFGPYAFRNRQDRDLNFQGCHLFGGSRRETRVVKGCVDRGTRDNVRRAGRDFRSVPRSRAAFRGGIELQTLPCARKSLLGKAGNPGRACRSRRWKSLGGQSPPAPANRHWTVGTSCAFLRCSRILKWRRCFTLPSTRPQNF